MENLLWGGGGTQKMVVKDRCTLNRGGRKYRLDCIYLNSEMSIIEFLIFCVTCIAWQTHRDRVVRPRRCRGGSVIVTHLVSIQ